MKPLRHTVPLGFGETPASFVSRLAALNGPSAREFCLDFGTTFQKVVDGDPKALAIVAAKGGVQAEALAHNAFVKTGERRYRFREEELVRGALRRSAVAFCPKCLAEDIAGAGQLRPELAPWGRALWQIAAVKSCHIHTVPLAVLNQDLTPGSLHDWSHHVRDVLPRLPCMADAERRELTELEYYVITRTTQGPIRHGLLDSLPLHVAIMGCELFGAVALFGRTINLRTLTDEEWRAAGGAGFDILADGKVGVEIFLEDLQATYPYTRAGREGPQALLGRIYQVLEFGREDAGFDALRDLVGDFIRTRLPVGPGDVVFGKPVEKRVLHSIRTLSLEAKLHPKRLRKLLMAAGVLSEASVELSDANCTFDAEKGSLAATEASAAGLTLLKAGEYLNAPRVHRVLLHQAGLIAPRIRGGDHGAADMFAPEDLDGFLDRLLEGAVPVAAAADGQGAIPEAAKKACCGAEAIVRLAIEGKLAHKWKLASERGYMSLLVDVEEIRALVRGADHGGFTGKALQARLQTTDRVTRNLIAGGHLKTETVIHPINRCPTAIVTAEEVERFEAEYVSLFVLAKQQRRHFRAVKKDIEAGGVKPAMDPDVVGATFYRRKDSTGK